MTGEVSTSGTKPGRTGRLVLSFIVAAVVAGVAVFVPLIPLLFFVPSFWASVAITLVVVLALTGLLARQLGTLWPMVFGAVLFLIPFVFLALRPLGDDPIIAKPAPWSTSAWDGTSVEYWELSTGSRLGYVRFTPDEPTGAAPIVFLHGGPGGGIVPTDGDFARDLTAEGFEVYLYDQAGVGWSDLLEIDEYTIERMVADLEAIRVEIGAEQLNLVGHSWGGSLATHYLVEHDDRVERAWLTNPGDYGGDTGPRGPEEEPDLTAATTSGIPLNGVPPARFLLTFLLSNFGAETGVLEDLVSQEQIVRYAPEYVDTIETFQDSRCAENPYGPGELDYVPQTNFNFYVNIMLNTAVSAHDKQEGLDTIETPMVIARGVCDHLPWDVQRHYRDNVAGARLIVIPGEGHDMRPAAEIAAFFATGDPGVESYTSDDVPSPG